MRFSPFPTSRAGYGDTLKVPTYREMRSLLEVELRRARRYEYPLGVVTLSLQPAGRPVAEKHNGSAPVSLVEVTPAIYGLLDAYLRNTLRETDVLTGVPEALAFATFLPGTDRQGAEQALLRFSRGFLDCSGYTLRGGVAAFPGDGLTIEDVLARACDAWRKAGMTKRAPSSEARFSNG